MSSDVKRKPFVIELVGTPGSGKTTLAREIVALLSSRGIRAGTPVDVGRAHARRTLLGRAVMSIAPDLIRSELLWGLFYAAGTLNAAAFLRQRRRLGRTVVSRQRRRPIPGATRRHILYWFIQLGGRHALLTKSATACDVLVLDDGFLHRSVHLSSSHAEAPDPAWIGAYVDLVPRPDLVVHVAAETNLCEHRVRERGVWAHSRHLSSEELRHYIINAAAAAEIAVSRARGLGWSVASVDNDGRPVAEIRPALERVLEPILTISSVGAA